MKYPNPTKVATVAASVLVALTATTMVMAKPPEKGEVCHKPGTEAEQTLLLPVTSHPGHLGHGDHLGPCVEQVVEPTPTPIPPTPTPAPTDPPPTPTAQVSPTATAPAPANPPPTEVATEVATEEAPATQCEVAECNICDIVEDAIADGHSVTININVDEGSTLTVSN